MSNSTALSRPLDSPLNHGPVVNVITWFLLVTSALSVLARLGTSLAISRGIGWDDYMILISLLFSIGQTVATSSGVTNGLGQHITVLDNSQVDAFQKSIYATNILFILGQGFAKLSVVLLIRKITPVVLHKKINLGIGGMTILWATTSVVVVAFQCHASSPWRFLRQTCINRFAFGEYLSFLNLSLDLALVLLPIVLVRDLKVRPWQRFVVAACFSSRILVIIAVVAQMVLLDGVKHTSDATFDYWPLVITAEVIQCLAIVTACIPYLKPFMESMESGLIRADDLRRRGVHGSSLGNDSGYSKNSKGSKSSKNSNLSLPLKDRLTSSTKNMRSGNGENASTAFAVFDRDANQHLSSEWDEESRTSRSKIIKQTKSWGITREDEIEAI